MKRSPINRNNPASAEGSAEELPPRHDPPAVHDARSIVLNIAGKRYEFALHTEVREITRGPAELIEMPGRSSIKR